MKSRVSIRDRSSRRQEALIQIFSPCWVLALLLITIFPTCFANPVGGVANQGTALITSQGLKLTVQTSGSAYINWSSFNIALNEATSFLTPSANSVVWNKINDPNPSQILGRLDANGLIVLQNSSGFFIGGQAVIQTGGLVLTTAPAPAPDIFGGGFWQFNAPPPGISIVNYGQIIAGDGGSVFLIGDHIENHGSISAPGGSIGLYAGKEVLVSRRPDGRGLSAQVNLPQGSVDNSGRIVADAGTIALHARVVNQGGEIQANSVREQNGVIEFIASESVNLGASSKISASADATTFGSSGGNIVIKAGEKFTDGVGSKISVSGGAIGGDGGTVEISAPSIAAIQSRIDATAIDGSRGGKLFIDPTDIILDFSGTDSAGSGTITAGSSSGTLRLNVGSPIDGSGSAFQGFSQIDLQATHDITLANGTTWDLAKSTGISAAGRLTLEAGNDIRFGSTATANITAGPGWSVVLEAGRDFAIANTIQPGVPGTAANGTVKPGVGNISLAGGSALQSQEGSLSLLAGNNITVNTGAIRTMNGGSIDVNAVAGSVNTGRNANGYTFRSTGNTVSPNLGGISTALGGDVSISAGGDITSFLPTTTSTSPTDAGSGAFGARPGVVNVSAGGNVYGHFVAADSERNGQTVASTITAQNGNAGTSGNLLSLSVIKGGWQVSAPHGSIGLQEVRNPNGVFNGAASGLAPLRHLFDYDPGSFVDLHAADSVFLSGTLLPRYTGDPVPPIYPGALTIHAGTGGVTLGNDLILFPSPKGELNVFTTDHGSLNGGGFALSMSDSGAKSWNNTSDFSTDHASAPVQLNNPNPVVLNIAGSVNDIRITAPKSAHITIGGDMNNTSFSGQNLHETDETFFNVTGKIFNQSVYSFVTLAGDGLSLPSPRFPNDKPTYLQVMLDAVVPGSSPASANAGLLFPNQSLFYIPRTHQIGYYGKMDLNTEKQLTGTFQIKTYGLDGKPLLDSNGNYVTTTAQLPIDSTLITDLYVASLNSIDPVNAPSGLRIGGPGALNITASALDLGVAFGVISQGPAGNSSLAKLPGQGAAININTTGNVDLFSSQISSYYGGAISINAGGAVNVGFQDLPLADPTVARGIWTSGHSDVSVIASGDINVAGSRIAAFNGGDIHVKSLLGNVDAGSGGSASVKVNEVVIDPLTHEVSTPQQPISGSGILATTFPDAPASLNVGNVTVETPRGNINASQGGIVQEPLNGNSSLIPIVTLTAGTRDRAGTIIYRGNINAGESGVIGVNTTLNAAGDIAGLVIARGDSSVNAAANVAGTFLAGGTASFSAVGTISGIAIGGAGVNVGSGSFQGVALSQNVSGGGAQSALASTATTSATSQAAAATQETSQKADTAKVDSNTAEDDKKRLAQRPVLSKYTGRVTVILPGAKQ